MASENDGPEAPVPSDARALEMYKIIVDIRNLDGELFWTRQNFYFAVSSLLLTAVGYAIFTAEGPPNHPAYLLGGCILGASIAVIWIANARAGNFLIWLWNRKLKKLERPEWPEELKIYRTLEEDIRSLEAQGDWFKGKYREVNRMAILLAGLFLLTWIALGGLMVVITCGYAT